MSCTTSSSPPWPWPTCTGPARTPTERPAWWPYLPGGCCPGSPAPSSATASQTRDFVFVDDVVDAFSRAAGAGQAACCCNIGTGDETSVNELYAAMATHAGVNQPALHAPARTGELDRISLDPGRAAIHLGWKPWTSLAEGTAAVLDWFRQRSRDLTKPPGTQRKEVLVVGPYDLLPHRSLPQPGRVHSSHDGYRDA